MLPVLDLSRSRTPAFLGELRAAAHDVGFLLVTGHGVDPALTERLAAGSREFFALPLAEKLAIENVHSPHFRGYTRVGQEITAGGADQREQLDIGLERAPVTGGPVYNGLIGPNQWPAALPGFRDVVLAWQAEMLRVSREILRAFAAALGQPEGYFDAWFDAEAACHVKIVHYPPRPDAAQGVGAHKDYGWLALLQQDEVGGLQVEAADGSWIEATPVPGTFVVNIGEMLEIATQGYLKATRHRVVSPAAVDRYSFPFFLAPRLDAVVEPIVLPAGLEPRGISEDPDNPLHAAYGENAWRGWLRSHPAVARRWWPDVVGSRE